LLPNEEFFINVANTIGSRSDTPLTKRLGPLHRTLVDDKVLWVTDDSVEMSVFETTVILRVHLQTLLYLSTISAPRICMSLVVVTKDSNQDLTLGTIETNIENILSASSNGKTGK
jgi:hypothetical protein